MSLIKHTEQLKHHLHWLKDRFEQNDPPKSMNDQKLFQTMKNETTIIFDLLEQWEKQALDTIKRSKMNVHPQQVVATKENIELLIMHSYYIDIRRRRYMEYYHSSLYVLNQLLSNLENES